MYSIRRAAYFLLLTLLVGCSEEKSNDIEKSLDKPELAVERAVSVEVSQAPKAETLLREPADEVVLVTPDIIPATPPIFIDEIVDPFFPLPLMSRIYPGTNIPIPGGGGKQGRCGNGIKQRAEECDDGNAVSRDGCSSRCLLELFGTVFEGPDGLADLYFIEPSTGIARLIGPIGFERVSGIDFSEDNVLYGVGERDDGSDTLVLITIDLATGAGTEVGPLGGGTVGGISDISFRNSDNALFAYDASVMNHRIFTINITTGAATLVGSTGLSSASGNAMSFDLEDILFQSQLETSPNPELNTINQTTGLATFVLDLQVGDNDDRFSSMDAHPVTGVMYGILTSDFPGTSSSLTTLNTETGAVRIIGETSTNLDGIAWSRMVP